MTNMALKMADRAFKARFRSGDIQHYLRTGNRAVKGWLDPVDGRLIATLGAIQADLEWGGATGEIGVHHGKLAILLYMLLNAGESGFCIDVFDQQNLNVDGSGRGDEARFQSNLKYFLGKRFEPVCLRGDSTSFAPEDITGAVGSVRLFSIDGGHTPDITASDLQLASDSMAEHGVVILDDFFNATFPGVAEGGARYLSSARAGLTPFAIGLNKVFLCRGEQAGLYRNELCSRSARYIYKESEFFGATVTVFHAGRASARQRFVGRLRKSARWRAAKASYAIFKSTKALRS